MMYSKGLVVSIKCDGKILREYNEIVQLPFGTEYSILLKNLNNRRVAVKIEIDGQDIGDNERLIIDANSKLELKRFINKNNAFKFIQKTEEISDYRGDRIDDGIIRVSYQFEMILPKINIYSNNNPYYNTWTTCSTTTSPLYNIKNVYTSNMSMNTHEQVNEIQTTTTTNMDIDDSNNNGITVAGSEVNQQFGYVYDFIAENETQVIILVLKGCNKDKQIEQPLFVTTKLVCPTCGQKHNNNIKYCPNCGTYLR